MRIVVSLESPALLCSMHTLVRFLSYFFFYFFLLFFLFSFNTREKCWTTLLSYFSHVIFCFFLLLPKLFKSERIYYICRTEDFHATYRYLYEKFDKILPRTTLSSINEHTVYTLLHSNIYRCDSRLSRRNSTIVALR